MKFFRRNSSVPTDISDNQPKGTTAVVYNSGLRSRLQNDRRVQFLAAAIIAIIGLTLIRLSFADTNMAKVASFEAETMSVSPAKVQNDTKASSGKAVAMFSSGSITTTQAIQNKFNQLQIVARGDQCKSAPTMRVLIDNKQVAQSSVASTVWKTFTYDITTVPTGTHTIALQFTNDYYRPRTCDRNLYIDKIDLLAPASTTPLAVALVAPTQNQSISGKFVVTANAQGGIGGVQKVEFWTDGSLRQTVTAMPYQWTWDTNGLSGTHLVGVVAYDATGNKVVGDNVSVAITNQSTPTNPSTSPLAWTSTFASGNFLEWGDDGRRSDAGTYKVVDAASVGVPARPGSADSKIALFSVNASQYASGNIHSKLYKGFSLKNTITSNWSGTTLLDNRSQVAGTYSAWYYVPANYTMPTHDFVDIFQFKEFYPIKNNTDTYSIVQTGAWIRRTDDVRQQWPSKTGMIANNASDTPVLTVAWQYSERSPGNVGIATLPLGRWFNISATVYPNEKVVYTLDGKPWTTVTNADLQTAPADSDPYSRFSRSVGLQMPANQYGDASTDWIFGVGHYGGIGALYVDETSFTPSQ